MNSKLIFMRRTPKEIEVFGGDIYIDIDGRNIGILSSTDLEHKISTGVHRIKMYKSHSYGSFIGHAEIGIDIKDNEQLLLRYTPPMLINQPGNIIVSDYKCREEVESLAKEQEYRITCDYNLEEEKRRKVEEKNRNGIIIFAIISIISIIMYVISVANI